MRANREIALLNRAEQLDKLAAQYRANGDNINAEKIEKVADALIDSAALSIMDLVEGWDNE